MQKLIRKNCFETNSSSTHSVSVTDNNMVLDYIYPNKEGNIVFSKGQFGWDWFKHNDALTKATYAYVYFKTKNDNHAVSILDELILDKTGAKSIINNITIDNYSDDYSYIDHQSIYNVELEPNKTFLENFIFNKNSWLFGGNDNDSDPEMFYDVPVITENGGVIENKVKYILSIHGLVSHDITFDFAKYPDEHEIDKAIQKICYTVYIDGEAIIPFSSDSMSFSSEFRKKAFNLDKIVKTDRLKGKIIYHNRYNREPDIASKTVELEYSLFDVNNFAETK